MKKIIFLIILLIANVSLAFSQEEDALKRERMFREVQEFKMKYLAQEMDLSEVQKKKFFEVYEEMSESKKECYQEAIVMDRRLKEEKNPGEEDYQAVRNAFNEANARWAEMEKLYDEKFSEFLSQKQIYQMKAAENSFRAKFDEMKHNRRKDHHKRKDTK